MDGYEVTLYFSPEDNYYVAQIAEFIGCATDGLTAEEALANLHEVKAAWIESMQRMGHPIPPPRRSVYQSLSANRLTEAVPA